MRDKGRAATATKRTPNTFKDRVTEKTLERKGEPCPQKSPKRQSNESIDLSQMSAYAVYNNLVPGVKSYQDTSESTQASRRKNKAKRAKALALKQEMNQPTGGMGTALISSVNQTISEPEPQVDDVKCKKKSKKRKLVEDTASESTRGVPLNLNGNNKTAKGSKKKKHVEGSEDNASKPSETLISNRKCVEGLVACKKNEGKAGKQSSENSKANRTIQNKRNKNKPSLESLGTQVENEEPENVTELIPVSSADVDSTRDCEDMPDIETLLSSKVVDDSELYGKNFFSWLIYPETVSSFMEKYWEIRPLVIKRGELFPNYFEWIISSATLDEILRRNVLKYSKNIDVVYYENGERTTISEEMNHRVRPAALWDYYSTGNSIRLLNPQTYCAPLRRLNAALQELFGTFVGANVYLTPPDAQGFAPHWDDIEAFVLQIEGKKQWKLYKPRSPSEVLARYSSKDFGKEESSLGKPLMNVVLEPGDMLYFPRGFIHQAKTVEGCHSMHITISCYQQNSWADLLKEHFSKVVDKVAASDVEFRKGLPTDYLSFMGLTPSKKVDQATCCKRKDFKGKLKSLITKLAAVDADDAADQMGKKFIWDSLPPFLTRKEKDKTCVEDGEFLNNGIVKHRVELDPDTKVKLIRKHCVRLISEDNILKLYFSIENPLVYHEDEPQFVEITEEFKSAVEFVINSYPNFVRVEDFPISDNDISKKIQIAADLWERGILITQKPLEASELDEDMIDFDEDSFDEEFDDEYGDVHFASSSDESYDDDDGVEIEMLDSDVEDIDDGGAIDLLQNSDSYDDEDSTGNGLEGDSDGSTSDESSDEDD